MINGVTSISIDFYNACLHRASGPTGRAKFDVQNPPLIWTLNEVPFDGKGALSHLHPGAESEDGSPAMRMELTRPA
jgi:hypothetical protein